MGYVLRKSVSVAGDGDPGGSPLKVLEKGTPLEKLPDSELAQLCGDHFIEVADDGRPVRDDERHLVPAGDDAHPALARGAQHASEFGEAWAAMAAKCEEHNVDLVGGDRRSDGTYQFRIDRGDGVVTVTSPEEV